MIREESLSLDAEEGVVLEARVALPASATVGIAVCHPHPLYGGDMENGVVVRMVQACAAAGLATLRFNFRGVGASTGTHDGGRGEQRDLESALAYLATRLGSDAVAAAGYSFGSMVTAAVAARQPSLRGVALIAPPLAAAKARLDGLAGFEARLLIVAGGRDSYCPRDVLEASVASLPRADVRILETADHFFAGAMTPLGDAVEAWARELGAGKPAGRGGAG
jgi:uncharacterized protein